jgi:hypothetical protein
MPCFARNAGWIRATERFCFAAQHALRDQRNNPVPIPATAGIGMQGGMNQ